MAHKKLMTGSEMHKRARAIQVGIGTAMFLMCGAAARADIGWSVDAGAGHTDNAALTDTAEQSDTLALLGGSINYEHESTRVNASLAGSGNYVHYADDTFDDDFQSRATGKLAVGIIPEKFFWSVDDDYGQISVDQFQPVTPENRQNVNTFTTGPDFIMRLGPQSDLKFSGRYNDTQYEESNQIDSSRWSGSITFLRHVSDTTSWGVVASQQRTEYDAPGSPEYEQPMLYGTWETTGARQSLEINVGANRFDADDESATKPLVRVNWTRRIATSWTMGVNLRSEYQNTTDQFLNQNLIRNPATAELGISQVPAANNGGELSFEFQRPRTRFSVGGGYSQLEYAVDNGLDEDDWYGVVQISRRHTPRLEGFVNYRVDKRKYDNNAAFDDTRQRAELGVDWRLGESLYMTAAYQYSSSDSDSMTNRYSANMVYLMFSIRRGTTAGPRMPTQ
jgi:hypothetical protein